jgi:outer membrane protein assembly factor BamE
MRFERQKISGLGAICAGALLALTGCKQAPELPSVLSPYKIDIQQGNVITQEMLSKLKSGMTRSQVKFVLGSPLVIDPFRGDRWDYVSLYQKQGKDVERRRITVIFDDDKLVRIEGDVTLSDSSLAPAPVPEKPVAAEKPPAKAAVPAEPAKSTPVVKPAAVAPAVAKPEPAKPAAVPAAVVKPEAVKPVAAPIEKIEQGKTETPKAAASKAEAAKPDSAKEGQPAEPAKEASAAAASEDKKGEAAKKDAPKEKPKPGFFGRMLDKLGI